MIGYTVDTLMGIWALFRLGCATRFRFNGPYWKWRLSTAYGRGYPTSRWRLLGDVLEYGRWMHRIRRGR